MKNYKINNTKQKGFSLIELGIVLVVISIAAGFLMTSSEGIQDGPKMGSMRDTHMQIAGAVQEYYGAQAYVGLSTASGFDGGLIPADLKRGTAPFSIATPFSGTSVTVETGTAVTAMTATAGVAGDHFFSLKYNHLPQAACKAFVPQIAKHSIMAEMQEAGGSSYTAVKPLNGQFNSGTMLTECAHDYVDVTFYYGN